MILLIIFSIVLVETNSILQQKNTGLYIEDFGLISPYSRDVLIPIAFHLPKYERSKQLREACKFTQHIPEDDDEYLAYEYPDTVDNIIENACNKKSNFCYLSQKLKPKLRNKRFAFTSTAILGIMGLATSVYNLIDNHQVTSQLNQLKLEIENNMLNNNARIEKLNIKLYNQGKLLYRISSVMYQMEEILNKTNCQITEFMSDTINQMIRLERRADSNAIQKASEGILTSHLLPHHGLRSLIKSNEQLNGSIYQHDPAILYQLSTTYLVEMDKSKRIFYYLIKIPIPLLSEVSILQKMHSVGWYPDEQKTHVLRLKLPKYVFKYELNSERSHTTMLLSPNLKLCKKWIHTYFCDLSEFDIVDDIACAKGIIIDNITSDCELESVSYNHRQKGVLSLRDGYLIYGYDNYEYLSHGLQIGSTMVRVNLDNYSHLISYSKTDFVMINNVVYKHFRSNNKPVIVNVNIDMPKIPDILIHSADWQSVKPQEPELDTIDIISGSDHIHHKYTSSNIILIWIVIILLVIGVIMLSCWYMKIRKLNELPEVINMKLLHSIRGKPCAQNPSNRRLK